MALVGYAKSCEIDRGGVSNIYLALLNDVASFTLTGDDYTAHTMESSKVFAKIEIGDELGMLKESVSKNGKSVLQTLEFTLESVSPSTRATIASLMAHSNCGFIVGIEEFSGKTRIVGYSEFLSKKETPARLESGETDTTTTLDTDPNSIIILTCKSTEQARYYTGSALTT